MSVKGRPSGFSLTGEQTTEDDGSASGAPLLYLTRSETGKSSSP